MPDSIYTVPILIRGDMLASLSSQPTNNGNPGDADFGIILPGVEVLDTAATYYRLNWYQNTNTVDTEFGNGQFWRLEVYDGAADPDANPSTGDEGWSIVPEYSQLNPKYDLVSNLGAGDEYIVFEHQGGGYLLYDLNGGLPAGPETLIYYASAENGDPRLGDEDGELDFYDAYTAAVCFASGTLIATPGGPRRVETLAAGDLVETRDHGAQPLLWTGQREISMAGLAAAPGMAPVTIRAGALGAGMPARDLTVSPQHRVLVRSPIVERMTGAPEAMCAARHLTGLPGISASVPKGGVCYHHLLLERHEVLISEGAETESLFPGPQALAALTPGGRGRIEALMPALLDGWLPQPARHFLPGRVARNLARRHLRNAKPLVSPRVVYEALSA